MKKCFNALVLCALSVFLTACDGSHSGEMLLTVIGFIFFFMWIGLFVRVCVITNLVEELKQYILKEETKLTLRENLILGNVDIVKRQFLIYFKNLVEEGYKKDKDMKMSIRPHVEALKEKYAILGEDIPVYIEKMQTYGDYYKVLETAPSKTEQ